MVICRDHQGRSELTLQILNEYNLVRRRSVSFLSLSVQTVVPSAASRMKYKQVCAGKNLDREQLDVLNIDTSIHCR